VTNANRRARARARAKRPPQATGDDGRVAVRRTGEDTMRLVRLLAPRLVLLALFMPLVISSSSRLASA
jgi:hypothetical protein